MAVKADAYCYWRSSHGGLAVTFAMALPVLMGAVGLASDYAVFHMKAVELQAAADAAAIAATRELSLSQPSDSAIAEVATSYVTAEIGDASSYVSTSATIAKDGNAVTVTVTDNWQPVFAHFLGAKVTPIVASATAELVGESKVCVLALTNSGIGAVSLINNAHLEANGCSVYSNSTSKNGFYMGNSATLDAALVCSAGGVFGTGGSSKILTDCPPLVDPLASRAPPKVGACDFNGAKISSGSVMLGPGVYCGGLEIRGTANIVFAKGNYIIKDGLFRVTDTAKVAGENVAFYLTGTKSRISFAKNATIDLSGAEDGEMAGLLFFEDRSSGALRVHNINATNAHTLTGTIYLPRGNLLIDPNASVAENSAYTAIIANRLIVEKGPNLVLNSDYSKTDVPVPEGIKSAAEIVLSE